MCAGSGERWDNYLSGPKWYAPIDASGTPLLYDTIAKLRALGITDLHVTTLEELTGYVKDLAQITVVPGGEEQDRLAKFFNAQPLWETDREDEFIYLYGDTFYTEACLTTVLLTHPVTPITFFGREKGSNITGKGWGELWAVRFADKTLAITAMTTVRDLYQEWRSGNKRYLHISSAGGWEWYRQIAGLPLDEHTIGDHFVEINDFTEDFDFPFDYDRWKAARAQAGLW
jgi:hypothetical protein